MVISIIVVLIVALVIIGIFVNAVQQNKQKRERQRRQETAKLKTVIEETENVLMNGANIPMSGNLIKILHKRIFEALKTMSELQPEAKEIKKRLGDAKARAESAPAAGANESSDSVKLPDNDKQLVAMLQGIKKLRAILRTENAKGVLDTQLFMVEDKNLEKLQLRINVESQIKRGLMAKKSNMLGSARQYFEKALATMDAQSFADEYTTKRRAYISQQLEEIVGELKSANAEDRKKRAEAEHDELDELFAPKKKW
ncbi:hypothetical protein [Flocculibacter collagenilyticus]|uniref:hypothetical protein n=1 Tax=Flocculibacter collagenilyticus TaxID=2744479 RepID=UPI0018F70A5C|nr:hypothetical protein [Flocculibacter collagenilyticus]